MIKRKNFSRRKIKNHVLTLLEQNNLDELILFFETNPGHLVLNALFSALCSPIESVRWRSVSSFGRIVPLLAERDMEHARVVMRRFLWSLNDESGGIGWGAPESLAEIMCYCEQLRLEYLHMLLSYMGRDGEEIFQDGNYLELPMLQRGLLWGVGKLSECHLYEVLEQHIVADVAAYLASADVKVAGLAIWVLGLLKAKSIEEEVAAFIGGNDLIPIYRDNLMEKVAIGRLAEEALQSMNSRILSQ